MNKITLTSLLLILITAFSITSCENEPLDPVLLNQQNNTSPGNTPNNGGVGNNAAVFKADFNGSTWTGNVYEAVVSNNMIKIGGGKANGEGFVFMIDNSSVGTYPANMNLLSFTPAGSVSAYGYWSINDKNPNEDTGSITITNIDTSNKTISGHFNFKGYWSDDKVTSISPIQFTNGVFENIPYITQVETNDTFFAKVGGTGFNGLDITTFVIGSGAQEFISIGAQDADLNSMTISVRSNLNTGTYPITGNIATDVVQAIYEFENKDYKATSGSVTIQSKTADRIKGTFNYVTGGTAPFTVTEGSFDVEY